MTVVLSITSLFGIAAIFLSLFQMQEAASLLEKNHIIPKDHSLAEFAMSPTELADTYASWQLREARNALHARKTDCLLLTLVTEAFLIHEVRDAMAAAEPEDSA